MDEPYARVYLKDKETKVPCARGRLLVKRNLIMLVKGREHYSFLSTIGNTSYHVFPPEVLDIVKREMKGVSPINVTGKEAISLVDRLIEERNRLPNNECSDALTTLITQMLHQVVNDDVGQFVDPA